jgi:hypothetical protein
MLANVKRASIGMALAASLFATTALAYDPIVLARGWYRVASDRDEDCAGEVGTNGQFYVLSIAGLDPGADSRLQVFNGDMPPIDYAILADGNGSWQKYYIPFRFNRGEGGMVFARVTAAGCSLALQFPWQRKKGWEERPPPANPYAH